MIMNKWTKYKLGELIDLQNGFAFKSHDLKTYGVPIVKIKNIQPPNICFDDADYYPHEITRRLNPFLIKKKDILISMTGSHVSQFSSAVGKVGRYGFDKPALLNQRVGKLVSKNKSRLNEDFLYYLIARPEVQFELAANAGGSANQANISPQQIKNLEFDFPDLPTQARIASILSAFDDKIENNRRMNRTLEQMAQTLFNHYFVDNIHGNSNHVEAGLLEIATLLNGGTPKTSIPKYWDGEINWISAKDVTPHNGSFILESERKITESGIQNSNAKLLPPFSTVITARGTVGNICLLPISMAISQSNYALKSVTNIDFVLFQLIRKNLSELRQNSYGTVFDTITTKTLSTVRVLLPDHGRLMFLEERLKPLYLAMLTNLKQNLYLSKSRDALLPKLMSGEIDVSSVKEGELLPEELLSIPN